MSRKISMARWLVMCARGVFAVHRYLVIMTLGTPRVDRNSAAADPAGPDPTISTSVSTVTDAGSSVSVWPSLNTGIGTPPRAGRAPALSEPVSAVATAASTCDGHLGENP